MRRVNPALVGLGFGTVWMLTGVLGLPSALRTGAVLAVLAASLVLALMLRRPRPAAVPRPVDRALLRWSVGGELAGIAAALAYGAATGRGDLVLPLVGVAVGLHFLPLAAAFHRPAMAVSGLLVTGAALAATAFVGTVRQEVVGFGAGLGIWATLLIDRMAAQPGGVPAPGARR